MRTLTVRMREDQVAALRAHAKRRSVDLATAFDELVGITAPVDDPDRADPEETPADELAEGTRAAMDQIASGALEDHDDRDGAIQAAERNVEENAEDVPPAKRKSKKRSPLSAWAADVKDEDEQPNDGHPARGGRR